MAYISNTPRGPLTKYGGASISAPGSKVKPPANKGTTGVTFGMPTNITNAQIPSPNVGNTQTSTPSAVTGNAFSGYTPMPPSSMEPNNRSGGTPYKPQTAPAPANAGGGGLASPGNYNPNQEGMSNLMTGLGDLASTLQSYQKGLVAPSGLNKYGLDNGKGLSGYNYDKDGNASGKKSPSQFGQFTEGLYEKKGPSKDQSDYLRKVEEASRRGEEIGQRAQEISDMYGSEIARVGNLGAGAVAGNMSTGTDVVGRGNANLAADSANNRMSALSAAQAAALQGTGQQLEASQQGITGMNNALTGANTQQQLGQQALQAGGQLAQPQVAQYGQTVFDPLTGQYTGAGGAMDPGVQSQQLAQQVMSGQMTYDQAMASLGYAGGAGTNFLNNALTSMGGNPLELQAQNAAQQANIATEGTAETNVALTGYDNATQTYMKMQNASQAAKSQAADLLNVMNTVQVNNQPLLRANTAINRIAEETNDPGVKAFQVALQEAQALYQRLLFAGTGTPTGVEQRALAVLDGSATPEVTAAAIQQLEGAANNMLRAQEQTMNDFRGMINSGGQSGGGNAPTGGSGGIWDW